MKTSFYQRMISFVLLLSMTILLTACPGEDPPIVTDVLLDSYDDADSIYLDLTVELDLGKTQLPSLNLPIANPYNTSVEYGELSLRGGFNGVNEVAISANLSSIFQLMPTNATLPDGSLIPMAGLSSSSIIQVPIANDLHRVYLAFGRGVAMMGFAITIKELDGLGRVLKGGDVLIPFNIYGVNGAAGFFTSTETKKTGIAVFVDIGEVITPSDMLINKELHHGAQLKSASSSRSIVVDADYDRRSTFFYNIGLDRKRKKKYNRYMYKFLKRKTRLHINR